jgi:hypothetical protein
MPYSDNQTAKIVNKRKDLHILTFVQFVSGTIGNDRHLGIYLGMK